MCVLIICIYAYVIYLKIIYTKLICVRRIILLWVCSLETLKLGVIWDNYSPLLQAVLVLDKHLSYFDEPFIYLILWCNVCFSIFNSSTFYLFVYMYYYIVGDTILWWASLNVRRAYVRFPGSTFNLLLTRNVLSGVTRVNIVINIGWASSSFLMFSSKFMWIHRNIYF